MINRVKKDKKWLIGGFVSLMLGLLLTPCVNAASTTDTALKKFESYGLSQCINKRFNDNFTAEEVRQKKMISDLLRGEGEVDTSFSNDMITDDNFVVLPAGHGLDLAKDDKISCVHLIRSFLGTDNNEVEDFPELLLKLGYVKKSDESGRVEKCARYSFGHYTGAKLDEGVAPKFFDYCELVDGDEVVIGADGYPTTVFNNKMEDTNGSGSSIPNSLNTVDIGQIRVYEGEVGYCLGSNDCVPEERVSRAGKWSDLIDGDGDGLSKLIKNAFKEKSNGWIYQGVEELDDSGKNASYATNKDSSSNAAKNFNLIADYLFDDSQVAGLYQGYILSYWNADNICKDTEDELKSEEANLVTGGNGEKYTKTKLYKSDGAVQYCYVKPQDNKGKKVYGVKNGRPNSEEKMDFDAVAKWLLEHGPDKVNPADLAEASKTDGDPNEKSGEATCRNSKGAESFGWIVCPLVTWLGEQAEDLYNDFVEPELAVEPELFNASDDGMASVREAWESFRDLANIAFIILLLVVIFSQVTGVGIDNYGIKKILPKLIVAAILINLSYLICLILIDLSNILGNGLQQFFNGLSGALGGEGKVTLIATDDVLFEGGKNSVTIGSRIAGVGALAAMVGATGTFVWTNPAILLSLLIGAISMTISIVFLFILLSVRKALIVILVTISPLAFVCFMLPNTKSLFDKWKKLFEGMLLIYPISGLLIGAGDYVSRILFKSADGFFMWITAMIVGVVPIFFLPLVIKGAFSAMGKFGTTLAGLGTGASKGVSGALRNSESFQRAQKLGEERRERILAQRRSGGYIDKEGKFQERGLRSRFAKSRLGHLVGADVVMGKDRSKYLKSQIERQDAIAGLDTDVNNLQLQQAENARIAQTAEGAAGVSQLTPELAAARAASKRSAQDFKAYQDQFAGFSPSDLRAQATSAGSWLKNPDGQQRMSALIQAMEANGMEKDITNMISSNNVSGMSGVMQTLAGSKNAVFSAYGKRGNDGTNAVSFDQFMSGDENTKQSMANYLKEKGGDAIAKLDDKSLATISHYQDVLDQNAAASGTAAHSIMDTNQLIDAAAQMKGEDSLKEINKMLAKRNNVNFSAKQLTQFSNTTIDTLENMRQGGNSSVETAMVRATDAIAQSPELIGSLTNDRKEYINNTYRTPRGLSDI